MFSRILVKMIGSTVHLFDALFFTDCREVTVYYSAWRTLDPLVNQGAHTVPGGPRMYQGAHSVQKCVMMYVKYNFKTFNKHGGVKELQER